MRKQADVEATCLEIYCEARDYFDQYAALPKYYGFNILQGPPIVRPPILFIGYQPGGDHNEGERERLRGGEMKWAPTCANATGSWPLSRKLQGMFTRPYLEKCVGMNALFLRSPNIESYENDFDKTVRVVIESFCLTRVFKMIEAIDPLKIVIIGFRTQELFDKPWPVDLKNEKQALTRIGEVAGRPAIAATHLTGSRGLNAADLSRIRDRVLDR